MDVFDEYKKRRLDNILQTNTPLFHAYYLKEDLDQIWMQKSKEEGEKQLCYWCERARETKLKPFIKVANTLMAKRTGILAWYEAHVTNATLEGINNKIKVMKRKAYGRPKQAADVFESAAYVDMLESKLDQMTNELVQMRKELQEMKEQQASKSLKETLSEMVDRAQARCQQMKEKLFEVKEEMHNKAAEIVKAVKQRMGRKRQIFWR